MSSITTRASLNKLDEPFLLTDEWKENYDNEEKDDENYEYNNKKII